LNFSDEFFDLFPGEVGLSLGAAEHRDNASIPPKFPRCEPSILNGAEQRRTYTDLAGKRFQTVSSLNPQVSQK
jgi:hypothetical protein